MLTNQLKLSRLQEFPRQKSIFILVECILFTIQIDEHLLFKYQLNLSIVNVFEAPQVKLERSASGQGRVKKQKYTVSSLPFPQGSANVQFTQRWHKVFKPSLIFWASCREGPFGTNALLDTVIKKLWKKNIPSVANAYEESKATICQVVSLLSSLSLLICYVIDVFSLSRPVMCSSIGEALWGRKGSLQ